jgi:hypothetical protein
MNRNCEIANGICLVQPPYDLDLHNNFDFTELRYSIQARVLVLTWRRSDRDWVPSDAPSSVTVEFRDVSEFRFLPRKAELPFTEDDCLSSFGYWTDADWANGIILTGPSQKPDPDWLTAFEFMSGAIIAVRAASADAHIEP